MDSVGKRSGATDASITNRQETEARISVMEDTIENIDTLVKENKVWKAPNSKYPGYNEKIQPKNNRNRRG